MDKYLDSFREMISLRGLTGHTLSGYCTYIRAYLDYLSNFLHKAPEDVSWDELRDYIRWLQKSRGVFAAKDYKTGQKENLTISCREFIRRFMMHVLPSGFQKIRYYGFLNNRSKQKNLTIIFRLQGHQKFQSMLTDMSMSDILKTVWNYDISICPCCGKASMRHAGRTYALRH